MNRGKYDFPNESERDAWYEFINLTIDTMLHEPAHDSLDFSGHDISPILLGDCVEAAGWCWEFTDVDREDSFSYYTSVDYPHTWLCIYADSNTFKLTLSVYDKEEK